MPLASRSLRKEAGRFGPFFRVIQNPSLPRHPEPLFRVIPSATGDLQLMAGNSRNFKEIPRRFAPRNDSGGSVAHGITLGGRFTHRVTMEAPHAPWNPALVFFLTLSPQLPIILFFPSHRVQPFLTRSLIRWMCPRPSPLTSQPSSK